MTGTAVLYFDSGGRKYYYLVPCSLTVATAQNCKWKVKYIFALLAFCTKWEEMRVFAYVITADTSLDPDRVRDWHDSETEAALVRIIS